MIYDLRFTIYDFKSKILNLKSKISNEKGVALMMVLWVMVFLTVIVSEFAHSMRVEVNITRNFKEEAEALSLSEAGLNLAFAEILRDLDYIGTDEEGSVIFVKKGIEKEQIKDKPVRKGIKLGSGSINYSITDEDSKININNASRDTIVKLLELSGVEAGEMRDAIADSIEDWRDEDSLHRLNGAEEDYYMSLPSPYHCKNGNFDTVEELLMVKGMTTEILYGNMEIASPSARKDNEKPENEKYAGIYQYLTVFGSGTINLNTAPELLLRVVKGDEEAKNIILKRQENKGVYDENQKSYMFAIESTGIISGVRGQGSGVRGEEIETQNTESGFNNRTTKVICRKDGSGKDAKITIRYWNDNYIPYKKIG
ncbi:MAG: general secretion pathway protein GspK [Nitrospinae bacterium]|nr:general secretion pathway protein GspK [Nitrospinota bacterium]